MAKIKIALCDLRHRTKGLHSYQMPLGIGMIAAHILNKLGSDIEIRLYKYADRFLDSFKEWHPHIIGGSFFSWNRRLTLHVLKEVKNYWPDTLTVLGGPELEIESQEKSKFLADNPYIDLCCFGEGEETFLEIVKCYDRGKDISTMNALEGTFLLRKEGRGLIENTARDRIPFLDDIPSPYTTKLFDQFFEEYLHPLLETHRGCPFTCHFCHMGLSENSRVTFQSVKRSLDDIEYCAERYRSRHDIQLCIGDNNFGMYPKDVELAKGIRRIQDEYEWPRYMVLSTGKNRKSRMIKISRILKHGLPFNMAAQSCNKRTLDAIGRKNISLKTMKETLAAVNNPEADSYTELIIGLPYETRQTFEDGLRRMIELNLNWMSILTLRFLRGTWLTLQETINKHNFDVRYRVICRQFGEYDGKRIIEVEGCVVGTDTVSFEEYCYLRELTYIIQIIYNSDTFNPIRRILVENRIDVWQWIKEAHKLTLASNGKPKAQLDAFMNETRGELFDSEESLYDFYSDDEKYLGLLNGDTGDNLISKYSVLANSEAFLEWLELADTSARNLLRGKSKSGFLQKALDNVNRYIQLVYNFSPYFYCPPETNRYKRLAFDFDLNRWMNDRTLTLRDCEGFTVYHTFFTEEQVAQIKNLLKSSHDISFSIQRVFRDKNYFDFIPTILKADGDVSTNQDQYSNSVT